MKTKQCKLIKLLNRSQQKEIQELIENNNDKHFVNYSILAISLQDDLVDCTDELLYSFYGLEDNSVLKPVDSLIAQITTTLTNNTDMNVIQQYLSMLRLDKSQPELKYLIDTTIKYIS